MYFNTSVKLSVYIQSNNIQQDLETKTETLENELECIRFRVLRSQLHERFLHSQL